MNQIEIKQEIMNDKEAFLSKVPKSERPIYEAILNKKIKQLEKNNKVASIAELTKELMETEMIKFDDDSSLTFADMHLAVAIRNNLSSNKLGFKEINDIQKVISNDVDTNKNGCTIIINTNGQDLGD